MATLTIADLDNGKRDLDTVDAVANSQADTTPTRYGPQTLTLAGALRRLGWQAPVPYAPGLNVDSPTMTVERDGIVYRPDPALVPFTTAEWNPDQWRMVQNTQDSGRVYQFPTLSEAQSAAAVLPEGTAITVGGESAGRVVGGQYVASYGTPAARLKTQQELRDLAAPATAVAIGGLTYNYDPADTSSVDDGIGVLVGVGGKRWKLIPQGAINVSAAGATTSSTNSRVQIQAAMNWAAAVGVPLIIDREYSVSADATSANVDPFALIVPSGLDMHFVGAGALRQVGAPYAKSSVLLVKDTAGANIWNPKIIGTRLTESPSLPEQNRGITILECSDVYIHRPVVSNTMGDSIYIGRSWTGGGMKSPTRVTVFEPVLDRPRRNGISCCAWDDVKIIRPRITNATNIDGVNAVLPKAGIDIEPEHDSADGAYKDRFKTDGLYIDSPVIDNCIVAAQILLDPKCVGMNIGVHFAGDFRFNASGETGLYPLNLNYIGSGCTGRVKFDSITDASPQTTGADVRTTFAWNYEGGNFPLVIDSLDTRKKTQGTYGMLWFMDVDDPKFSTLQGGVNVNMRLSKQVRGALGYRNPASMNATRKLVHSSFTSEDTENGGYGVENQEFYNTGAIPQGDWCYFDAIRIYNYNPPVNFWGNRVRVNDTVALNFGKFLIDVRNRAGVFEILRPWSQAPDGFYIGLIGGQHPSGGTIYNSIRSNTRSANIKVRSDGAGVVEVLGTTGDFTAFNT